MKTLKILVMMFFAFLPAMAQEDLMSMLEEEMKDDDKRDFTIATFKTTRIIQGHPIENVAPGVLDFSISQRFGYINGGAYELFGLDQATMRLGLDYGLTKNWMIGIGRSTYQKQYDGFTKYKIIRQATNGSPITLSAVGSIMYKSIKFDNPNIINY